MARQRGRRVSTTQAPSEASVELVTEPIDEVLRRLGTSNAGLTTDEALAKIESFGPNKVAERENRSAVMRFLLSLRNPLVVILLFAGFVAGIVGETTDAVIVFSIVLMSLFLTFIQESRAENAAEELKKRVETTATVLRDRTQREILISDIVPGDIVHLSAGDIVPADSRLMSSKDLFVDQASLTGESFPVEKFNTVPLRSDLGDLSKWDDYLFMGTSVLTGTGTVVVVKTGGSTEFGKIAKKLVERKPETEFEHGLRRFGFLIMEVTFLLVMFVFFVLALKRHDVLQSILFSVALAVGLTPELLPMIVTVNLSKGALAMSKKGVIVKRLSSIQNFGNMDILCTDKTGTLTENKITLVDSVDASGAHDHVVFEFGHVNSEFQTGLRSPLDVAVLASKEEHLSDFEKVDEVPFDFTRKRVSVAVLRGTDRLLITKGAPEEVLKACTKYGDHEHERKMTVDSLNTIESEFHRLSEQGYRVLGVAYKHVEDKSSFSVADESEMVFLGFLVFTDPPKETAKESLAMLRGSGIEMKILTGDNEMVTRNVCEQLGFEIQGILLGSEIAMLHDDALARAVEETNIFARVTPAQKDRVISALRRNGHVVGYLGDGVNDAPSMRIADVSISVNNAVDVAKESADIILIDKKLKVLYDGVIEGRKTFGNTMKYVLMAISSNFGNMFSAAGASLFLPFLPMLPIQVLLNNLLYDVSELAIPTDNVDSHYVEKPKRLNVPYIRDFMLYFGPISSVFDFLTFIVLIQFFGGFSHPELFQTGWFTESLITQTLVIFIIRTRVSPFYKSRPGKFLVLSSVVMVILALALPYTPVGQLFQFARLPAEFYLFLLGFTAAYLFTVELMKSLFYKHNAERIERSA